jgi:hypothetical protein
MKLRAIAVAALLLSACSTTEYTFTPPETAEGRACVERCQRTQQACRHDRDARAEDDAERCAVESRRREEKCDIEANVEYVSCLKFAKTNAEREACVKKDCSQPSCERSASYALCDSDYRACYQNCGGRIGVIER